MAAPTMAVVTKSMPLVRTTNRPGRGGGAPPPQHRRAADSDADKQRAAAPIVGDHQAVGRDDDQRDRQDRPLPHDHPAGCVANSHDFSASSTTFVSRKARVSGPTPPGLGDTWPATSHTSGSTSPT